MEVIGAVQPLVNEGSLEKLKIDYDIGFCHAITVLTEVTVALYDEVKQSGRHSSETWLELTGLQYVDLLHATGFFFTKVDSYSTGVEIIVFAKPHYFTMPKSPTGHGGVLDAC
jgi:hypothetical protein